LKTNPSEKFPTGYGLTCYGISFSGPPRLNEIPELNGKIAVREMYIFGAGYNYAIEPPSPEKTSKTIIQHMMFITMLLMILVYWINKYKNRLYIYFITV